MVSERKKKRGREGREYKTFPPKFWGTGRLCGDPFDVYDVAETSSATSYIVPRIPSARSPASGEATKRQRVYLLVAIPGGGGMTLSCKRAEASEPHRVQSKLGSHKGTALSSRTISFKNRPLLSLLEISNHFWFEILSLLRSLRKGALPL